MDVTRLNWSNLPTETTFIWHSASSQANWVFSLRHCFLYVIRKRRNKTEVTQLEALMNVMDNQNQISCYPAESVFSQSGSLGGGGGGGGVLGLGLSALLSVDRFGLSPIRHSICHWRGKNWVSRHVKGKNEKCEKNFCASHTEQNVEKLVPLGFFFSSAALSPINFGGKQRRSEAQSVTNGCLSTTDTPMECWNAAKKKNLPSHSSYTAGFSIPTFQEITQVMSFNLLCDKCTEFYLCTDGGETNCFQNSTLK